MTTKLRPKQKKFVKEYIENGGNGTKAAKAAYNIAPGDELTPRVIASENLTKPNIQNALLEALPDDLLATKHLELLNATRLDHMVFPLGPVDEDDVNLSGAKPNSQNTMEDHVERTTLTDGEIKELLAGVNCQVRRIVHGETARHVYFWAYDNMARDKALDKAYKLRGSYAPEKRLTATVVIEPSDRIKSLADKLNG